jgi:hypothetical protein
VWDADLEALGDAAPVGAVRLVQRQQLAVLLRGPEALQKVWKWQQDSIIIINSSGAVLLHWLGSSTHG